MHFAYLLEEIEAMMQTGVAIRPLERTFLTGGALDRLLVSKQRGGARLETPELLVPYRNPRDWRQPPPAPPAGHEVPHPAGPLPDRRPVSDGRGGTTWI